MNGDREGLIIARMCGATAAAAGETAVTDCPADRPMRWRKAWTIGFARSCISRFRRNPAGVGLTHVKPAKPGARADWSDIEQHFLTFTFRDLSLAALEHVLGRPENAIRIKAHRLELRKSR